MLNVVYMFLVLIACYGALTYADYFEECEGKDGTFIAVQEDCSFFIYCDIDDSYRDSCPEDNPYFSAVEMTCDTDRKVCGDRPFPNGDFDENEETTTISGLVTDLVIVNTTVIKLSTTIPTESSTNTFSNTSLKPSSTTSPNTIPTASPSVLLACPQVDDPNRAVFVAHPKSCSEYFLCYHGQRLPMRCSHMLHFDFRQQKCDYAENVKCHVSHALHLLHITSLHFTSLEFPFF